MMADFTRNQARTINDAWAVLEYLAAASDMGTMKGRLRDALKYERAGRGSLNAKALILREARVGFLVDDAKVSEMYSISDGLIMARIIGARLRVIHGLAGDGSRFEAHADGAARALDASIAAAVAATTAA